MVYEDGDGFCEYLSRFWEGTIDKFSHLVKFGRINKETEYHTLNFVPFYISFVPTIFSYAQGHDTEIYTYNRM